MADEKTEEATPRKQSKERDKGNISKSQDLNSAVALSFGCALLLFFSSKMMDRMIVMCQDTFTNLNPNTISETDILAIFAPFISAMADAVLPFLIILVVTAVFYQRFAIGHLFATEKIKPDMQKLSPNTIINGLKKMLNFFSPKNLVELAKSIAKVLVVGACGYSVIMARKDELALLIGANIETSFAVLGSVLVQLLINVCIVMLIIGFLDKKYQDYSYKKSLKMTKQEIKDEWKSTEGDPKIKSRIKSAQMQFTRHKMMSKIPQADVVVVNPTHYSVVIKYDRTEAPAPMVVAKGVDYLAFKIREIAKANNVPIVENPPLARALYKLVKIDAIIPAELYVAVAEILAYVYNKNRAGS